MPEKKGFNMNLYAKLDLKSKIEKNKQLLTEIEILKKSRYFIGSFSSNISMFLGMARGGEGVYAVDANEWLNWRGNTFSK
jgi:hypothetical protein